MKETLAIDIDDVINPSLVSFLNMRHEVHPTVVRIQTWQETFDFLEKSVKKARKHLTCFRVSVSKKSFLPAEQDFRTS